MYGLIRSLLFMVSPESAHRIAMRWLKIGWKIPFLRQLMKHNYSVIHPSLQRTLWGITFPNPVGLAAGFDKDAKYTDALACLGFGFIEIGTVTPRPQSGNPKPRLFRVTEDKALINRMGFNNQGVFAASARLQVRKDSIIIGGNIGKNKDTRNEDAVDDYESCFNELYDHVDYFVVNVSSPNTPGLRALQSREPLTQLLTRLQELNAQRGNARPILLKIAPDLSTEQVDDVIEIVQETGIQGIVATNTTIDRSNLHAPISKLTDIGDGGLSGKPLQARSTEIINYIHNKTGGTIPIIATGGIFTAEDAIEKLNAGASLVQVYTGFIYEGPAIAARICKGLLESSGHA
ncbi:MAG: quinone-dependent dihydroorotate dehydrogenase [Taibaiella sp.]|nr:quinone-dependent dihydroorotate dehydrogenase [Taibaiella sp.]